MAIDGMSDPSIGSWTEVGAALSIENTDDSEEGQGIASDGNRWFISSNGSQRVVVYDDGGQPTEVFAPSDAIKSAMWNDAGKPPPPFPLTSEEWNDLGRPPFFAHFGGLCYFQGLLYVPIQTPFGVWRIDIASGAQKWILATDLPESDPFPWCSVHPVTGVLYTSNFANVTALRAYDRDTLARRPADDITLGPAPLAVDSVQGASFTAHGRVVLVRSDGNALFCFSSLNGYCFGAIQLGDFGSSYSEVEAVTVRSWQIGGKLTPVHVLELDNDLSKDDLYLHSFHIPDPGRI